ncbi:MAG: hypothetical protein R3C68_15000 [Myxococcota bacterium]
MAPLPLPLPSRRCTPAAFYGDYLPQLWRSLMEASDTPQVDLTIAFHIQDPTPQHFTARVHDGVLTTNTIDTAQADLSIQCQLQAWTAISCDFLSRLLRHANRHLGATRSAITRLASRVDALPLERLQMHAGMIEIHFEDDAGDLATFHLSIRGGHGPSVRLYATESDLWTLLESSGGLSSLLRSRIRLEGDVGYIFRLAAFLEGSG